MDGYPPQSHPFPDDGPPLTWLPEGNDAHFRIYRPEPGLYWSFDRSRARPNTIRWYIRTKVEIRCDRDGNSHFSTTSESRPSGMSDHQGVRIYNTIEDRDKAWDQLLLCPEVFMIMNSLRCSSD